MCWNTFPFPCHDVSGSSPIPTHPRLIQSPLVFRCVGRRSIQSSWFCLGPGQRLALRRCVFQTGRSVDTAGFCSLIFQGFNMVNWNKECVSKGDDFKKKRWSWTTPERPWCFFCFWRILVPNLILWPVLRHQLGCFGVYSEVISVGQQGNILMNHWLNEYVL